MPRERIAMSPEEVAAFAATQHRATLATVAEDGPCGDVVACAFADRALLFAVPRTSRSYACILQDPRVCCILEASGSYYEIKGVMVHGPAVEIDGAEARQAAPRLFDAAGGEAGAASQDGRAIFRVALGDVASFDFGKIQRRL